MAGILSLTLIRVSQSLIGQPYHQHLLSGATPFQSSPLWSRLLNLRGFSDRSKKPRLIEVDLGPSGEGDAASSVGGDVEVISIRRLEDVIHGIAVRKLAPEWLPFVPGASYWVPPRRRGINVEDVVGKLQSVMSVDERMSLRTTRGWPSSEYFIEGVSPGRVRKSPKKIAAQSDDEE